MKKLFPWLTIASVASIPLCAGALLGALTGAIGVALLIAGAMILAVSLTIYDHLCHPDVDTILD